jgi:hypothetical protein
MNKRISTEEIKQLATEAGLEPALAKAVVIVEAGNSGFDARTGKIKIQFEPHVFKRYTGLTIENGVELQTAEWKAFEIASKIDHQSAMLSTSWGMGQIMGFNHLAAGYDSVQAMVSEFKLSEFWQIRGMLTFIQAHKPMLLALKVKDWDGFARLYNGKNYKKYNYASRLADAYTKALKTTQS